MRAVLASMVFTLSTICFAQTPVEVTTDRLVYHQGEPITITAKNVSNQTIMKRSLPWSFEVYTDPSPCLSCSIKLMWSARYMPGPGVMVSLAPGASTSLVWDQTYLRSTEDPAKNKVVPPGRYTPAFYIEDASPQPFDGEIYNGPTIEIIPNWMGRVRVEQISVAWSYPLTVEVRKPNGELVAKENVELGIDNTFPIPYAPAGTYDVCVRTVGYISRKLTNITVPAATPYDFGELRGGDVNADDRVDDYDLADLVFSFGTVNPNYPTDVNRDGIVNDFDLAMVIYNFNRNGDCR